MQSQTILQETFKIVIFWGMIRGYDSRKSNIMPLLKRGHVKKRHSHIYIYIYRYIYIYIFKAKNCPILLRKGIDLDHDMFVGQWNSETELRMDHAYQRVSCTPSGQHRPFLRVYRTHNNDGWGMVYCIAIRNLYATWSQLQIQAEAPMMAIIARRPLLISAVRLLSFFSLSSRPHCWSWSALTSMHWWHEHSPIRFCNVQLYMYIYISIWKKHKFIYLYK